IPRAVVDADHAQHSAGPTGRGARPLGSARIPIQSRFPYCRAKLFHGSMRNETTVPTCQGRSLALPHGRSAGVSLHNWLSVPVWAGLSAGCSTPQTSDELTRPGPGSSATGGAAKALWYSVRDVLPQQVHRVLTFGELSRSPVEEGPAPRPRLAL